MFTCHKKAAKIKEGFIIEEIKDHRGPKDPKSIEFLISYRQSRKESKQIKAWASFD
jgi:hypothetical protein